MLSCIVYILQTLENQFTHYMDKVTRDEITKKKRIKLIKHTLILAILIFIAMYVTGALVVRSIV